MPSTELERGVVLAIEGGGSHTRVVLGGEYGGVLFEAHGGPGSALYVDPARYTEELSRLIGDVMQSDERPVRIGCAGPMDRALVGAVIEARYPGVPWRWYAEGEIALGVYRLPWGVSVVAGTGSSSRAAKSNGEWVESGGFGPQFSDEGSGYWIGRAGVAAVLAAEHRLGPATALRAALFEHFGIEDAWGLVPQCVGNGHLSVTRVAAFGSQVCCTAAAGDEVARAICATAAGHLAALVMASTRRAGFPGRVRIPVVPTGGVFRAREEIFLPFKERLLATGVLFDVREPVPDPMAGLLNLLCGV